MPETLNLQALDGYNVGGTLHLVQNNQVGFTTDPDDARSTRWASDIAKGFDVPIIHVNADDVSACIAAVRLAWAFRKEFGHDVMIDLIGYRRFGHNEADEPAYTQPAMYERIKHHKRVADIWADQLVAARASSRSATSTTQKGEVWNELTTLHQRLRQQIKAAAEAGTVDQPTGEYQLDRTPSPEVKTAVSARAPARSSTTSCCACPTASRCIRSSSSSSSAAATRSAPAAGSTGRTPSRWRSRRC